MTWTATDNFDSYANGNNLNTLNGGAGFSGAWANSSTNFKISNALSVSGSLSASIAAATSGGTGSGGAALARSYAAIATGEFTLSIYKSGSADSTYCYLSNSSAINTAFGAFGIESGNFVVYHSNFSFRDINTAITMGIWHTFKMRFDAGAGTFAVSIDGGAYSSNFTFGTTNPDSIVIYKGNGGLTSDIYYDSLGPVAAASTAHLLGTTGVGS